MKTLTLYKHLCRFSWFLLALAAVLFLWRFERARTLSRLLSAQQFSEQHYYTLWTDSLPLANIPLCSQAYQLVECDSMRLADDAENAKMDKTCLPSLDSQNSRE